MNNDRTVPSLFAAVLLGVWLLAGKPGLPTASTASDDTDERSVSRELREAADPVASLLRESDKKTRAQLAAFWAAVADDIDYDKSPVTTTGQLRKLHEAAGPVMFKGKHVGPDGLGKKVDAMLKYALGEDDTKLDDKKRRQAVDAFNALSQAAK